MTILYVILSVTAFFAIILNIRLSFIFAYDSGGVRVNVRIGIFTFKIIPFKEKKKKRIKKPSAKKKDKTGKKGKTAKKMKTEKVTPEKKLSLKEIIPLAADSSINVLKKIGRYIKLEFGRLHITVASPDAFKTALLYGTITQTAVYIFEFLGENFNSSVKSIKIECDYTSEKIRADVSFKFSMKTGQILSVAFTALTAFLKIYMRKN